MQNFLIVGCGISGLSFSRELAKKGISYKIVDPCEDISSTYLAGGLINPVTGRKQSKQWNIQALLSKAEDFYTDLNVLLHRTCFKGVEILKIFKNSDHKNEWAQFDRTTGYTADFDFTILESALICSHGGFLIRGALQVDTTILLGAYRHFLETEKRIWKEKFFINEVIFSKDTFTYRQEVFTHLVFCDGIDCLQNGLFDWLPFKPAKGERLILEINELPAQFVYNKDILVIPVKENIFWAGATNTWNDLSTAPTETGKSHLEMQLHALLKMPWKILDHQAAIRPTIKDRTPVVGSHPRQRNIFLLNGMGTKGMSLAPYYAEILLQHILTNSGIPQQVNVLRFAH